MKRKKKSTFCLGALAVARLAPAGKWFLKGSLAAAVAQTTRIFQEVCLPSASEARRLDVDCGSEPRRWTLAPAAGRLGRQSFQRVGVHLIRWPGGRGGAPNCCPVRRRKYAQRYEAQNRGTVAVAHYTFSAFLAFSL